MLYLIEGSGPCASRSTLIHVWSSPRRISPLWDLQCLYSYHRMWACDCFFISSCTRSEALPCNIHAKNSGDGGSKRSVISPLEDEFGLDIGTACAALAKADCNACWASRIICCFKLSWKAGMLNPVMIGLKGGSQMVISFSIVLSGWKRLRETSNLPVGVSSEETSYIWWLSIDCPSDDGRAGEVPSWFATCDTALLAGVACWELLVVTALSRSLRSLFGNRRLLRCLRQGRLWSMQFPHGIPRSQRTLVHGQYFQVVYIEYINAGDLRYLAFMANIALSSTTQK